MRRVYAVILVGGMGKRLRPLSTYARPKPFLSVMRDGSTMLQETVRRILPIVPRERIILVANKFDIKQSNNVMQTFQKIADANKV